MNLFIHYCLPGFTNCYILGADASDKAASADKSPQMEQPEEACIDAAQQDAILIDPGVMDEEILNYIEGNNYALRGVLITHDHISHIRGLRTIQRIYKTQIYAINPHILDQNAILLRDGELFSIGPFNIETITVPGHSSDSAVFRIENFLFTGDVLSAGLVGTTASSYGAAIQMTALRNKVLSLPGEFIILPGHGPPSSMDAEKRFNAGIQLFEQRSYRRSSFNLDFL
ncbi:MAG: MBL fold metallo-hydrolase [Treponema sp.]|jgi:glyoxylase-like metal-dependent hydrolase (beta-lactamase superfamily II)|nr:MBL fold metallo-hydrolase [Treponema sp.]